MLILVKQIKLPFNRSAGGIPLELAYMTALIQEKGIKTHVRDFPIERGTWKDVEGELPKSFYYNI